MKVLAITGALPYPPTDGWRIRVLSLLRALARQHRVTLCSFTHQPPEPPALEAAREWFAEVHWISRSPGYGLARLLRGAVGRTPFPVLNYRSPAMHALVRRLVAAERFDALHVVDIQMAQYTTEHGGQPRILDLSNVESGLMRRFARHQRNPFTGLYARLTAGKLVRYETRLASTFDRILTCSEEDRALVAATGTHAGLVVVPNGVDTAHFAPRPHRGGRPHLVFVGRMDYSPNADAVLFFCRSILPLIRATHPDASFAVVGQHPPPAIQALVSTHGITVTGFVDDVRSYLAEASVVVVPIRFGSGTRLKILEAMAMEKAVVSTTIGGEGIHAVPDAEIVLADDPRLFAAAVGRLLDEPARREQIGRLARRRVHSDYSWERIAEGLLSVYDTLPGRAGPDPSHANGRTSARARRRATLDTP